MMGTSNSFGGPGSGTPLVPTWLEPDTPNLPTPPTIEHPAGDGEEMPAIPAGIPITPPAIQPVPIPNRFTAARTNFTQFAKSNGGDSGGLRRAVSNYVSKSAGGSRQAARRMGASHRAGSRLLNFMANSINNGVEEALQELDLEQLAGRPIQEIFLGMIDYICPDGGTIDEAIARDAFVETISDLAVFGITDLNALTSEQLQTVFELYATHSIENRLYNDIANNAIQVPANPRLARQIQVQLFDFIRRGVADVLAASRDSMQALTKDNVGDFVNRVYENAFAVLQSLGEMEAVSV